MWQSTTHHLQETSRVKQARRAMHRCILKTGVKSVTEQVSDLPCLSWRQTLTHKESSVALSRVIRTFTLPILKFSSIQGESQHVLGPGRH